MTSAPAEAPLQGIGVLVTRPREQARGLATQLQAMGAQPILFPALEILPPADPAALQAILAYLDAFQLAIFISPSAARLGMAAVSAARTWPAALPVAAIGKGTAKVLHAQGIPQVLEPDRGADSEHLLGLPQLQDMAGKKVVIFRGEGGREMLADTLRQRGAQISYAECYRRGLPEQADPVPVLEMFSQDQIQALTVYSSETLDNLLHLLGDAGLAHLRRTPLFVPHERIAAHARELGFETVITSDTGDHQLVHRLVEYFTHEH